MTAPKNAKRKREEAKEETMETCSMIQCIAVVSGLQRIGEIQSSEIQYIDTDTDEYFRERATG